MVALEVLLSGLPREIWHTVPEGVGATQISGLELDSRRVRPGELFAALPGQRADGARFVEAAWKAGAAAVLIEGEAQVAPGPGPVLRARHARRALALLAVRFHDEPTRDLSLIGVTGTDGKTSTAWFTRQILAHAGRRAAGLGTLGITVPGAPTRPWGAEAAEPARTWSPTTPEAPLFQATLARLRAEGMTDVVAEISSHALDQERVFGSRFAVVALTQVSVDHLDFHGTREAYLASKRKLFDPAARGDPHAGDAATAVLNLDDAFGASLAAGVTGPTVTYGRHPEAEVRLLASRSDQSGLRLEVAFGGAAHVIETAVLGRFHGQNLLAAVAIAHARGLSPAQIASAAGRLEPVPGRFESLALDVPGTVIVDYAHTAEGLANVLAAAREICPGRLGVVFGCGGDRDREKRGPMGEIAARQADRVIVTTDNPRSEDPRAIAQAVADGVVRGGGRPEILLDRRAAFARALAWMDRGDILVAAGRGAEQVQVFADRAVPFDDREVLRAHAARQRRSVGVTDAEGTQEHAAGERQRAGPVESEHPWSIAAIARMTRATVAGISPEDWRAVNPLVASGISLDSRRVAGGEVFVALPGERADGHDHIGDAFEAGACAAIARRDWWSRRKAARAKGIHFLVDDPALALQAWARDLRRQIDPRVLAITGSSGKTMTKELAAALLEAEGGAIRTLANRNNLLGLPWTLLQLRPGDRRAVVELGTNQPGEIERLTEIARPTVALITCVGQAHIGAFGSRADLMAAKLGILQGCDADATIVIPDDDPELEEALRTRWSGKILRFGFGERADVRGRDLRLSLEGTELEVGDPPMTLRLRLLGEAGARAALAALAGVRALGVTEIDPGRFQHVAPFPGRLDPIEARGVTWLLDMYNASPESVRHGLRLIEQVPARGRRVFVFGGMRELGDLTAALHQEIGRAAGFCDAGVFLGDEARLAAPEAQKAGVAQVLWTEEAKDVVRFLREYLRAGDLVYLKGARAAALEGVAEALGVVGADYGAGF